MEYALICVAEWDKKLLTDLELELLCRLALAAVVCAMTPARRLTNARRRWCKLKLVNMSGCKLVMRVTAHLNACERKRSVILLIHIDFFLHLVDTS